MQRSENSRRLAGIGAVVGVVVLFTGFTLMSRLALTTDFALSDLAAFRFGIGGIVLLPLFLRHGLAGLRLGQAVALALLGGLGFALLAYSGFSLAPSRHAAVMLHGTLPLFGAIAGVGILGYSMRRGQLIGLAMICVGVLAIGWGSLQYDWSPETLLGDVLLLCASASWALYGALVARWQVAGAAAAAIVAALSLVMLGAFLMASGHSVRATPDAAFFLQALFHGILIGAVSLFLYTRAVTLLGATVVALAISAVPPLTVLGAMTLLAEVPTELEWAGVVLTSVGMTAAIRLKEVRNEP